MASVPINVNNSIVYKFSKYVWEFQFPRGDFVNLDFVSMNIHHHNQRVSNFFDQTFAGLTFAISLLQVY